MNNIFVGNLAFAATKDDVRKLFESFGTVVHVAILEKKKGTSRGFGFVDMPNDEERAKAIAATNGKDFMGRPLKVTVVVPKFKSSKPKKIKPGSKKWTAREEKKPWVKSGDRPSYRREDRGARPGDKKEGSFRPSGKPYEGKKPFRKDERSSKPWPKPEGAKPYRRDDRENRPYRREEPKPMYAEDREEPEGKPYVRNESKGKPWLKMNTASKPSYKKFDGPSRPRREGPSKPYGKPGTGPKKFFKSGQPSKPWPKKGS
jgi:RNA recognition motif-containing protein